MSVETELVSISADSGIWLSPAREPGSGHRANSAKTSNSSFRKKRNNVNMKGLVTKPHSGVLTPVTKNKEEKNVLTDHVTTQN